jgi:hypothetical protein
VSKEVEQSSTFKPGEVCPTSGQYAIVDREKNPIGTERTVVRGASFPPTPEPGQRYVLVDATQLVTPRKPPPKQGLWDTVRRAIVPGILAIYLNASLVLWGWVLLDVSTGTLNTIRWLGFTLPDNPEYVSLLRLACYAAIGGAIGGIVFGMQNLWKHTIRGEFKIVFAGDYLFRQLGAAALAVVVFALIRGGVLTALGTDPTASTTTTASAFSSFAIGFLSGFGSYQVTNKLDELIKQAFGSTPSTSQQRSREPSETPEDTPEDPKGLTPDH